MLFMFSRPYINGLRKLELCYKSVWLLCQCLGGVLLGGVIDLFVT